MNVFLLFCAMVALCVYSAYCGACWIIDRYTLALDALDMMDAEDADGFPLRFSDAVADKQLSMNE